MSVNAATSGDEMQVYPTENNNNPTAGALDVPQMPAVVDSGYNIAQ